MVWRQVLQLPPDGVKMNAPSSSNLVCSADGGHDRVCWDCLAPCVNCSVAVAADGLAGRSKAQASQHFGLGECLEESRLLHELHAARTVADGLCVRRGKEGRAENVEKMFVTTMVQKLMCCLPHVTSWWVTGLNNTTLI